MHRSRSMFLAVLVAFALAACSPGVADQAPGGPGETPAERDGGADTGAETVTVREGTVSHVAVEGGCWVIEDADGTRYEPLVLGSAYKVEGTRVRATLRPRPEMASVCQTGQIVEIVEIEPLEDR